MKRPIYLDYAATTPVDPQVAERMMECLTFDGTFGNPASRSHAYGWQAEEKVEYAREQVANLVKADPREIVWTSGATESDNLALKGVAQFYGSKRKHIITSKIEHKAILDTCRELEEEGFEITYLEPEPKTGLITPEMVQAELRPDTLLVSLMMVNNEIGTVTDVAAIGELTRANKTYFHVDAAQAAGKVEIDLSTMKVDLMSFSGHKVYGLKALVLYLYAVAHVFVSKHKFMVVAMNEVCAQVHLQPIKSSVWVKHLNLLENLYKLNKHVYVYCVTNFGTVYRI